MHSNVLKQSPRDFQLNVLPALYLGDFFIIASHTPLISLTSQSHAHSHTDIALYLGDFIIIASLTPLISFLLHSSLTSKDSWSTTTPVYRRAFYCHIPLHCKWFPSSNGTVAEGEQNSRHMRRKNWHLFLHRWN